LFESNHFPDHKTDDEVADRMDKLINEMKANSKLADSVHGGFIEFWRSLWEESAIPELIRLRKKVKEVFDELMSGEKSAFVYSLIQLVQDF
jgi:hypothetical protein